MKTNNKIAIFFFVFSVLITAQRKNVLFIAVDDLKPNIHAFGDTIAITPNIDRLAEAGVIFENNQCQQAVCGPSRASLLTGWRPDKTQVWDLQTLIRDRNPDVITLPQYFKEHGYVTYGTGKIFDPRSVDEQHDAPSWSEYARVTGHRWIVSDEHVSTECVDTTETVYVDAKIAAQGLQFLEEAAGNNQPFFIAVGFKKPHLPFVAPAYYWNFYDRDTIPLAPFQQHAANTPDFIYNNGAELRNNYADIPQTGEIPTDKQKELVHGYYACVSFIDAQVGKLLNKLDTLGLSDNTIVILWGDHGWHLGDHAQWTKHTNFEQATRAPMIIYDPAYSGGKKITAPTEFLDIYPTLCDLTDLEIPDGLAGVSLKPIFENRTDGIKNYAISQYSRGGYEGYSLRTERYRYTEWITLEYREGNVPYSDNIVAYRELYDYFNDPLETVNFADDENYAEVRDSLHAKLADFLIHQFDGGGEDTLGVILRNPDFEEGISPWRGKQCEIRLDGDFVQHGNYSLYVRARSRIYGGAMQNITAGMLQSGGGRFYVSGYYMLPYGTDTAKIQIRTTVDGVKHYYQIVEPIETSDWVLVGDTLDIEWDGNLTDAIITFQTKSDITVNYYIDNMVFRKDTDFTDVSNSGKLPSFYTLEQNYPNPFNPTTTIEYTIPNIGSVEALSATSLRIYNVLGEEVAVLVNEKQSPGNYAVKFDASDLPSGTYFCTFRVGGFSTTKKMVLVK